MSLICGRKSHHTPATLAPAHTPCLLCNRPAHSKATLAPAHTPCLLFNRPAHSKATLGDRSFSFASSSVWNSIANDVTCAPSLSSFMSRLKTYFFRSVYKDLLFDRTTYDHGLALLLICRRPFFIMHCVKKVKLMTS